MARNSIKTEPSKVYYIKSGNFYQGPYNQKPSVKWSSGINREIVEYILVKK